MDFIKRHYEKLLLLFTLVLFIGIMIYVVQVAEDARSVKDSQLTFKERDLLKNVVKVKTADDISKDYNANSILQTGMSRWQPDDPRQLAQLGAFMGTLPNVVSLDVLPYHVMGVSKYREMGITYPLIGVEAATHEQAKKARQIILAAYRQVRGKQSQ